LFFQFCDVDEVAITHKVDLAKFGYLEKNMKGENLNILRLFTFATYVNHA